MANPRAVVYELLNRVATESAYANLLLPSLITAAKLDARDAGFATELGFGVLRWQGLLDAVIARAAGRTIDRIDPPLRDVLRMGAYQALLMRVPPHAVVDTSVDLAAQIGHTSAKGFVNAALRRVTERQLAEWQDLVSADEGDDLSRLAVRLSHPRWQVAALADALGGPKSELQALLECDNTAPPLTGVSRCGEAGVAELLAAGGELGRWSPRAVRLRTQPAGLPGVAAGRLGVQDEGSQLVALTLAHAALDGSDAKWLDLCAGPGGKTALLAAESVDRRCQITAVELQQHRAELVRKAVMPFADRVKVDCADATDARYATADYDRVMLDAPCTGLGVLRRRPESRWRREPGDVGALSPLQRRLLTAALAAVRPGGVVGYATCSPHLAETEFVVQDVLAKQKSARLLDARAAAARIPGLLNPADFQAQTESGPFLRLWPQRHDTDGMFLALLTRD